jgi:uncharacterized membrane protein YjjP (DUF1212 family)
MGAVEDLREINLTLDLCLRIGEMLMSSGAGAADVRITMESVAMHLGLRHTEIDVTFTSLQMSYQYDAEAPPVVQMRLVKQRDIDYEDLTAVDHLVRDLLTNRADLYTARTRMATIVSMGHVFPRWSVTVAWGVMCATIGVFVGGGWKVAVVAGVTGMAIDRMHMVMQRRRLPFFYQQVAGGLFATVVAAAVAASPLRVDVSLVVTANIIMLLAGLGLLGAIQDALTGFYITASARLLEVMLATAGIISGVSGGLAVAEMSGIPVGRLVPGRAMGETVPVLVICGALAAAAFAFASYAPRRSLLPIAVVTAAASLLHYLILSNDVGRTWAAAIAAFFVGLVAFAVAGRVGIPPLVVVVPGIVPFLPGLSIYRGLSLLAAGDSGTSQGILSMVTAGSIAVALSSGVILGEYVAQPLKREARRLESRLAGPRLVGPMRARRVR